MPDEPTIVVNLDKEQAEFLVSELDGMTRGIARDLETDPNINQEMARLALSKLLAVARTIVDAAFRAGIVLEWLGPDLEDN